ncbi:MAG TPA: DUF742 domain-containing protein [Acidimicrobiia bacterium]
MSERWELDDPATGESPDGPEHGAGHGWVGDEHVLQEPMEPLEPVDGDAPLDDELEVPHRAVVRPYVLTRGRTSSSLGAFELHAPVLALIGSEQLGKHATPEDRKIVELCQTPTSVAELAARLGAPVGVVRVLVGDLADAQMVQVRQSTEERAEHRDVRLLERLLEGIRAL